MLIGDRYHRQRFNFGGRPVTIWIPKHSRRRSRRSKRPCKPAKRRRPQPIQGLAIPGNGCDVIRIHGENDGCNPQGLQPSGFRVAPKAFCPLSGLLSPFRPALISGVGSLGGVGDSHGGCYAAAVRSLSSRSVYVKEFPYFSFARSQRLSRKAK